MTKNEQSRKWIETFVTLNGFLTAKKIAQDYDVEFRPYINERDDVVFMVRRHGTDQQWFELSWVAARNLITMLAETGDLPTLGRST